MSPYSKRGQPGVRRLDDKFRGPTLWILAVGALVWSVWITGFTPDKMRTWSHAWTFVTEMFPPDWSVLPDVLRGMGETVAIAFLGTAVAFVLAFPISFITARNITPWWIGSPVRGLMTFMRSVPEWLWAVFFVLASDFGNPAGVLAIAAHNIGILTKLVGEVYEEAPAGQQEAMASTGAPRSTVIWYGILPWAVPGILSHTFFRFECNVRNAALLGIVGAGGIGRDLMLHRQLFQYNAMTVDVLGIVALVMLADWLGAAVRKQVS